MKKISIASLLVLALTLTMLSGCGGGGGGGVSSTATQHTTAVLTLSTAVTGTIPPNTNIESYKVMITLPAGVTVKATPDSINPAKLVTDSGVVTASGKALGADPPIGIYIAATNTLSISIYSTTGFDPGEFCKVTCVIAAGSFPTVSSFNQPTFIPPSEGMGAVGLDLSDPLHPSNPDLTGQLSLTESVVLN